MLGSYPSITRQRSGLFSLDLALSSHGELGIPMRTMMELYGYTNVGKSTLSYYLSGILTQKGQVTICDLEGADQKYIKTIMENTGLDGDVLLIDGTDAKKKERPHEEMLQETALSLYDENVGAVILDSFGAVIPTGEKEGDFGEAFMGKRAKLIAQVCRDFINSLRNKNKPSVAIVISHVHAVMGGRGHQTIGGETPKFLSAMRIMMWPKETLTTTEEDMTPLGFYVNGKIEKLRYGGRGREFGFYIVPGYGVHVGASAMFDCFELGLAERSTTVKINGKSLGYLKKDLLTYAAEGKQRKFDPFVDALSSYEKELLTTVSVEESKIIGAVEKKSAKTKK